MADDTRTPILFGNKASAPDLYLKLNLDTDLYDSDTRTLVGAVVDDGGKPTIPINKKYAIASGLVQLKKFKVSKGTGVAKKTRTVEMLVRADLADTIDAAATTTTKTLKLGRGLTAASWTIDDVV